jgi:hypothetical protein
MMNGYINVQRSIQETPEWREKRVLSRFEAWFDMLCMAAFVERRVNLSEGVSVTLQRGEILASQRELSKRWGWSASKVNRYLKWLKSPEIGRIEVHQRRVVIMLNATPCTRPCTRPDKTDVAIIKLCNYDKYNGILSDIEMPREMHDETSRETTINKYIELRENNNTHTEYRDLVKFFAGACAPRTREECEELILAAEALDNLIIESEEVRRKWMQEDVLTRNVAQLWRYFPRLMGSFTQPLTKWDLRELRNRYEFEDIQSVIAQMANKIDVGQNRYQSFFLTFETFAAHHFGIRKKRELGNPSYCWS